MHMYVFICNIYIYIITTLTYNGRKKILRRVYCVWIKKVLMMSYYYLLFDGEKYLMYVKAFAAYFMDGYFFACFFLSRMNYNYSGELIQSI